MNNSNIAQSKKVSKKSNLLKIFILCFSFLLLFGGFSFFSFNNTILSENFASAESISTFNNMQSVSLNSYLTSEKTIYISLSSSDLKGLLNCNSNDTVYLHHITCSYNGNIVCNAIIPFQDWVYSYTYFVSSSLFSQSVQSSFIGIRNGLDYTYSIMGTPNYIDEFNINLNASSVSGNVTWDYLTLYYITVDITTDNTQAISDYISNNNYHSNSDYISYGTSQYNSGYVAGYNAGECDVDITTDNAQAISDYISNNNYHSNSDYISYGSSQYNSGYTAGQNSVDITTDNAQAISDYITNNNYHSNSDYTSYGTSQYNSGYTAGQNSIDITTDNAQAISDYITNNNYHSNSDYTTYGTSQYNSGYTTGYDDGYFDGHKVLIPYSYSSTLDNTNYSYSIDLNDFVDVDYDSDITITLRYSEFVTTGGGSGGIGTGEFVERVFSETYDFYDLQIYSSGVNPGGQILGDNKCRTNIGLNASTGIISFEFLGSSYADLGVSFNAYREPYTYTEVIGIAASEYNSGYRLGYNTGETAGYNGGYSAGETAGYNSGYSAGETAGYNSGYSAGETAGYDSGYTVGFTDGGNHELNGKNTFASMMYSIIDAPFNVLSNAFDFDVFGINIGSFLMLLVTLLIIAWVIRRFI